MMTRDVTLGSPGYCRMRGGERQICSRGLDNLPIYLTHMPKRSPDQIPSSTSPPSKQARRDGPSTGVQKQHYASPGDLAHHIPKDRLEELRISLKGWVGVEEEEFVVTAIRSLVSITLRDFHMNSLFKCFLDEARFASNVERQKRELHGMVKRAARKPIEPEPGNEDLKSLVTYRMCLCHL